MRIGDGNQERADLRRRLAEASDAASEASAIPSKNRRDDADDSEAEDMPATVGARRPMLPRFSARGEAAIEGAGHSVAALTMRHLGGLAAGDNAAWRGVKQAKDMSRQVLMARIGIHHRLLFRVDDGALDVLDLVTRENLQLTLKGLRSR